LIAEPIIIAAGVAENALVESMVPLPQAQAAEKFTTPAEHAQIETRIVDVEAGGMAIPALLRRSGCHRGSLPDDLTVEGIAIRAKRSIGGRTKGVNGRAGQG
jgi:hypothetical protein